jgi:hypothetical protein
MNTGSNRPTIRRGVTLNELVVCMGCLAVLMPLVVASAGAIARPNRERMCAYRLSRLSSAMLQYTSAHDGWLPGSPGTSGAILIYEYPDASEVEEDIPTDVTQIWDWAAPLAGTLGLQLDPNRASRVTQLRRGHFWCPSNNYVAQPYVAGDGIGSSGWSTLRLQSYFTSRRMMYFGENVPLDSVLTPHARPLETGRVFHPPDYAPRMSSIAQPAAKSFLADGSRFQAEFGPLTYAIDPHAPHGGMFSSGPPTLAESFLRSYFLDPPEAVAISYRHAHGTTPGLNAVHVDGHVEWVSEPATRQPDRWYPSGTIILRQEMNNPTILAVRDQMVGNTYVVP